MKCHAVAWRRVQPSARRGGERVGSGFDADDNTVVFVWPCGEIEELPSLPKQEVAAQLLDRVEKLRAEGG